ncbi:MAG: cupin domain-containing protein [Caldilineales bacterium]|nr:cupin domain-containing protein [Caldilineales bacterium]
MNPNPYFLRPLDHARTQPDKAFKTTFFHSDRLLVGLNTLAPGQKQSLHEHADQDKFYLVLAGSGLFTVGDERRLCEPGQLALAPAGVIHGVENAGDEALSFLTVIAPAPG